MSDWSQLIGPYKTREEAEHAREGQGPQRVPEKGDEDEVDRPPEAGRSPARSPRAAPKLRRPGRGPGAQLRHPAGSDFLTPAG